MNAHSLRWKSPSTLMTAVVLCLVGCGSPTPGDSPAPSVEANDARTVRSVRVPTGTPVQVSLDTSLNSGTNQPGDRFTARVTTPVLVAGEEVIPAGSAVAGTVTAVKAAKQGAGNATMTLEFTNLTLPDSDTTSMSASFSDSTSGKKKRNSAIIGGSAAGGAILGRVLGDDTKDAVVGAVVGGAIGTGVVMAQEGAQVSLPAGTLLNLELDAPLSLHVS